MKLMKVKGICQTAGTVITVQHPKGLDVQSWVGDGAAFYPIRGIKVNAEEIRALWDVDNDKMVAREIEDARDINTIMENAYLLIDVSTDEVEEICDIDGMLMLYDKIGEKSVMINTRYLAPCENKDRNFAMVPETRCVAVYAHGVLEGLIVPVEWKGRETERVLAKLTMIYSREGGGRD